MDIRTSDADTFIRLTHLVAALDRKRFTDEQLEIIDAAVEAIVRVEERKEYNNARQRAYMAEKRKDDSYYAQSNAKKATKGNPKGRPKKNPETKEAQ